MNIYDLVAVLWKNGKNLARIGLWRWIAWSGTIALPTLDNVRELCHVLTFSRCWRRDAVADWSTRRLTRSTWIPFIATHTEENESFSNAKGINVCTRLGADDGSCLMNRHLFLHWCSEVGDGWRTDGKLTRTPYEELWYGQNPKALKFCFNTGIHWK